MVVCLFLLISINPDSAKNAFLYFDVATLHPLGQWTPLRGPGMKTPSGRPVPGEVAIHSGAGNDGDIILLAPPTAQDLEPMPGELAPSTRPAVVDHPPAPPASQK